MRRLRHRAATWSPSRRPARPGHINAMATGVRHFVAAYPPETLAPGDVLITNDPWMTAGQINDITVVTPVFRDGGVVALLRQHLPLARHRRARSCRPRRAEVYRGGAAACRSSKLAARRAAERGAARDRSARTSARRTRRSATCTPRPPANDVGARSLLRCMDEFGLDTLDAVGDGDHRALRAAMRAAIARAARRRLRGRGAGATASASAIALQGRGDGARRRDRARLRRLLAAEPARHQRRAQLHPRLRLVRDEGGASRPRCRTTRARSGRCA